MEGAFPLGGNSKEAAIFVPAIGAHVLVEFIEGDRSSPIWTATYYPRDAAQGSAGAPPASYDNAEAAASHPHREGAGAAA